MAITTLRVRARGTAMVCNLEALNAGGWPANDEPVDVPNRAEYRQAVREGDLWAADQETAAACGVQFDPTFGG